MRVIFLFLILIYIPSSWGYKLAVIQGVSNEKQTFLTRNGAVDNIHEGQKVTFTSNNVSVIATAKTVTHEFTQWELDNDFSDVPFQKGKIVTMYDAQEYLWTLNPEASKRKYIKTFIYSPRQSLEAQIGFTRGLSESTSEAFAQNTGRGGFDFSGMFKKEFSLNWSIAYGLRYTREIINLPEASLFHYRFLGVLDGRYYFDPIKDFYNSQFGFLLGMGYGQSRTESDAQTSFGNAVLLPAVKLLYSIPISKSYDLELNAGLESYRLEEENAAQDNQTTNLTLSSFAMSLRYHL